MSKRFLKIVTVFLAAILFTGVFSACSGGAVQHSFPSLIPASESETDPQRPIDRAKVGTAMFQVKQADANSLQLQLSELLHITSVQKKRPVFTADVWPQVRETYAAAVKVCDRYMKNAWNDGAHGVEKVLAIHDYLASQIEYDAALYEEYVTGGNVDENAPAFEITGVFLQKKAVCEGLAKAFVLLCAIEGIEARYVRGRYTDETMSVPHAWNKVLIDGVWYNADVTLDDFLFLLEGKKPAQYRVLNHGFFLRSDRMMSLYGGHAELPPTQQLWSGEVTIPAADGEYDYYGSRNFPGLEGCPMTASSAAELEEIFQAVRKSSNPRVGAIEVRLDFAPAGEEPFSDLEDYAEAIRAAYRSVPGSPFKYVPNKPPPFARYPGGVFAFMIYV